MRALRFGKRRSSLWSRFIQRQKNFPSDEKFGLTSQIRRASVSIPANIAEGAARQFDKEFLQFVSIAQGSCSEVETELLIAEKLGFLAKSDYTELKAEPTR